MEAYAKLVDRRSLEDASATEKREFLITELPCTLGRSHDASGQAYTIVIDGEDIMLSRKHAEIKWSHDGGWRLICLSKNGLFVDGQKYRKDDYAPLTDGSDICLGHSRLILILPTIATEPASDSTSRKRSLNEALTETDDAEEVETTDENVHSSSPAGGDHGVAPGTKMSYQEMIDAAFNSYELDLDEEESVLQTELVDWIATKYYKLQEDSETRKQSLRKGLYSILMKHYERVGSDESIKRQKRGTIRWRLK